MHHTRPCPRRRRPILRMSRRRRTTAPRCLRGGQCAASRWPLSSKRAAARQTRGAGAGNGDGPGIARASGCVAERHAESGCAERQQCERFSPAAVCGCLPPGAEARGLRQASPASRQLGLIPCSQASSSTGAGDEMGEVASSVCFALALAQRSVCRRRQERSTRNTRACMCVCTCLCIQCLVHGPMRF